jgi:hypothetical protein
VFGQIPGYDLVPEIFEEILSTHVSSSPTVRLQTLQEWSDIKAELKEVEPLAHEKVIDEDERFLMKPLSDEENFTAQNIINDASAANGSRTKILQWSLEHKLWSVALVLIQDGLSQHELNSGVAAALEFHLNGWMDYFLDKGAQVSAAITASLKAVDLTPTDDASWSVRQRHHSILAREKMDEIKKLLSRVKVGEAIDAGLSQCLA